MSKHVTFDQILSRFVGPADFALSSGASNGAAKQIFRRKSIPSQYWLALAAAGTVTLEELAEAAAVNSDIAEPSHTDEHNNTITDGPDYGRVTGELARG